MKINIHMLGAICGCAALVAGGQDQAAPRPATFFVSPQGNDVWSGKLPQPNQAGNDGPFASLERARDEIRRLKAENGLPPGGVVVELTAGRHERRTVFALAAEDSGTAEAPVVYRGQSGAEVVVTGGMVVGGWQPVADPAMLERLPAAARGQVVQTDLKALGIDQYGDLAVDPAFNLQQMVAKADAQGEYTIGSTPPKAGDSSPERIELFCNNEPMDLARGPNEDEGYIRIGETLGENIREVRGYKTSIEGIFHYEGDYPKRWAGENAPYVCGTWARDWSEQRHRIETHDLENRVLAVAPPYHYYGYGKGQWFYGFNLLAELDRPGEWYLDRESGILYFWPPVPVAGAKTEVSVAPGLVTMSGTAHVTLQNLLFETTRGTAITMTDAEHCRVVGCTLRNLGIHAVTVVGGKENGVVGCDMYGMGGGGVYLIGGDRPTLTPAGHFAENNHIHHYARWTRMYRPAIVLSGVGLRASHNLIHDAPHAAIIFGGNEHLIEYNEIHSVCHSSNDAGALYIGRDWTTRGHVIQYNYFHHIAGRDGRECRTIYLDDSFAAATIRGNIFFKTPFSVFIGGGRDNLIENNIFIDCWKAMQIDARGLTWQIPHLDGRIKEATEKGTLRGIRFREPPYSTRYPQLLTLLDDEPYKPKGNVIRRNIFWPGNWENLRRMQQLKPGSPAPDENWWDAIYPQIRELVKMEDNLINIDPGFADEQAGDFRLRDDSPALALGFEPIPVGKIGLHQDGNRASWPPVHAPRPLPIPQGVRQVH